MTSNISDLKRASIIKEATAMFLKHGFKTVSMDKIAQAAPVSKATLYKYFASKNHLLAAVVAELCASLLQTMNEISMDSENVESNLSKLAAAFVDLIFSEEGLATYRLVVSECYDFPELGQLVYDSGPKILLLQLEQYLVKINQFDSGRVSPAYYADAFLSLLKGDLHFQCLLGIKRLPTAIEKKAHINQVVTLYRQGFLDAH